MTDGTITKMEKYTSTERKNTDKEWWENEILTPLDKTLTLSSRSYELTEQALELLRSDCPEDLSKIDVSLYELQKNGKQSYKILQEIKDKLNKKYPKREYDPRMKNT